MKKIPHTSELNQAIEVKQLVETGLPDGNTQKSWQPKFTTPFVRVEAISNTQGFTNGVSEKEAYYELVYRYHPDRVIAISDKILWGGKELWPVGDCVVNDFGNKRFLVQKVKYRGA